MYCAEAGLHVAPGHAYLIKQRCRESFQSRFKDGCRLLCLKLLSFFLNLQTDTKCAPTVRYFKEPTYSGLTSVLRIFALSWELKFSYETASDPTPLVGAVTPWHPPSIPRLTRSLSAVSSQWKPFVQLFCKTLFFQPWVRRAVLGSRRG